MIFTDLYKDQLRKPHTSLVECDFDAYFDQQVKELEESVDKNAPIAPQLTFDDFTPPSGSENGSSDAPPPIPGLLTGRHASLNLSEPASLIFFRLGQPKPSYDNGTSTDVTPIPTPENSRPGTPLASHLISGKRGGKMGPSRRAKKATSSGPASSGDEQMRRKGKSGKQLAKKALRRWDADGMADEADGATLDYSASLQNEITLDDNSSGSPGIDSTSAESSGTRTSRGQYVLKDLDNEVHSILGANEKKSQSTASAAGVVGSSLGAISGLFRNVIGGKVLTKADLDKPMKGMEEHLLKKNVAREAAVRLCDGVERELIGVKTGSFESICNVRLSKHT